MKKQLFFMAAAALTLASCSNEEVVEINESNAIEFRSAMGTRAVHTNLLTCSDIWVTAITNGENYFTNEVYSMAEDGYFKSPNKYRWPNSDVDFYSFTYGVKGGNTMTLDTFDDVTINNDQKTIKYTPADDVANQVDLAFATAQGKATNIATYEKEGITLNYSHILSQLSMFASVNDESPYKFEIKAVKIMNLYGTGIYDIETGEWSYPSDVNPSKQYVINFDNIELQSKPQYLLKGYTSKNTHSNKDVVGDKIGENAPVFIPQASTERIADDNGVKIAVLLKITTKDTGAMVFPVKDSQKSTEDATYGWAYITDVANSFEKGKNYLYGFNFTNGAGVDEEGNKILNGEIMFSVKWDDDWETGTSSELVPVEINVGINTGFGNGNDSGDINVGV